MNLALILGQGARSRVGGGASSLALLRAAIEPAGGRSGIHEMREGEVIQPANTTWTSFDKSSLGNLFTQNQSVRWPTTDAGGAIFDGDGTNVEYLIDLGASAIYTIIFTMTKDDDSTVGRVVPLEFSTTGVNYSQGSSSGFTAAAVNSVLVNGASITTQGGLYTALHQQGERLLRVVINNSSNSGFFRFGRASSSMKGRIRRVVVLDNVALGAGLAAAITLAEAWVQE